MELLETKEILLQKPPIKRQAGWHVSEIIRDLLDTLENRKSGPIDEAVRTRMEAGFAVERAFEDGYKSVVVGDELGERIDEIELDGIWGSPDGVVFASDEGYEQMSNAIGTKYPTILDEVKATWMSERKTKPHEVQRYRMQVLAYLKMLSEEYGEKVRTVRFWCYYVNGDYTYPMKPHAVRYTYEASDQEVEENWAMIVAHKKRMEARRE
jgi:hypothetical protein